MDKNGNKTGGRQKGTPNKVNASIKARIKDFLIRNEVVMQAAFMEAKPGEKLKFWFNMTSLVCAKQTSSKDDGEWRPGEDIVADWSPKDEWFQKDMDEQFESLLGNRHKNEKVLKEQLALAKVFKECNDFVHGFTTDNIHDIMKLFPNETEGRRALYHTLKCVLDEKVDEVLDTLKIINPIKYSDGPFPTPIAPANPIYDNDMPDEGKGENSQEEPLNESQQEQTTPQMNEPECESEEGNVNEQKCESEPETDDEIISDNAAENETVTVEKKINEEEANEENKISEETVEEITTEEKPVAPKRTAPLKNHNHRQPFYVSMLNKRHKRHRYA